MIFLAASQGKNNLVLPILGAGIYGWSPVQAAAIINKAVKDSSEILGERMPQVSLHDLDNRAKLTSELIQSAPMPTLEALPSDEKNDFIRDVCSNIKQQYFANPYWHGMEVLLPKVKQGQIFSLSIEFKSELISSEAYYPKAWDKHLQSDKDNNVDVLKEKSGKLLKDYASRLGNFFKLHWNRHHVSAAKALLKSINEQTDNREIAKLIAKEYRNHAKNRDFNPVGSYARRLKVLLNEANKQLPEDQKEVIFTDISGIRINNPMPRIDVPTISQARIPLNLDCGPSINSGFSCSFAAIHQQLGQQIPLPQARLTIAEALARDITQPLELIPEGTRQEATLQERLLEEPMPEEEQRLGFGL